METDIYSVYVKTDSFGHIIAVNSSEFLADTTGWVQIDEGTGDKYHHAQANYFQGPIVTGVGAYRYKLANGVAVECTADEIAEQEAALEPETPAPADGNVWDELDAAYREGVNSV